MVICIVLQQIIDWDFESCIASELERQLLWQVDRVAIALDPAVTPVIDGIAAPNTWLVVLQVIHDLIAGALGHTDVRIASLELDCCFGVPEQVIFIQLELGGG